MERLALLAIDTSSEMCSVGVCLPRHAAPPAIARDAPDVRSVDLPGTDLRCFVAERETGAVSSIWLLPAVAAVLGAAGLALRDCGALAFGAGPGSFTGLRTATGVAQGLAFGAALEVLPVNTLMACAEAARQAAGPAAGEAAFARVFAAIDARMAQCYSAAFVAHADGGWRPVGENRVGAPEAAVSPWEDAATPYAVVGNALAVFGARLAASAGAAHADPTARPGAAAIAAIGWRAWRAGWGMAPALALPDYVRDKVALTTLEREQERARKDAVHAVASRAAASHAAASHVDVPGTDA